MRRAVPFVVSIPVAVMLATPFSAVFGGETPAFESPAAASAAQTPSRFTNLEILPPDISRDDLVRVMRGFAGALGVQCDHCHVGDDPDTLVDFDFAADDKEAKAVARAMMRMVGDINGTYLPATGRDPVGLIDVGCVTCHHGTRRPQTLAQVLTETYEESGVDAVVARYRELRDAYYGRAVYDFGRATLSAFGETLALERGDPAAGIRIYELNIEFFPEWGYNYFQLGRIKVAAGDREAAIADIERAIELEPDSDFFKRTLARIRR